MEKQTRFQRLVLHFLLVVFLAIFILPFIWVLLTAVKRDQDIFAVPPRFIPVAVTPEGFDRAVEDERLPEFLQTYGFGLTSQHYRDTFEKFPFILFLRNTTIIVIFATLGTLISCSVAAYAFACLRWPDRDRLFFIVIATMLLPYQVTLIPLFMLFRSLGWVDTLLPLIVPHFFGTPFFIFLLRQFFFSLPRDLFEAARIDGASEFSILWRIVLPLSKPALLTVSIFAAMFAWNDFLGPLIYLSSESKKTLAVGLQAMTSQHGTEWGLLMAAGSVMIIPVLILFFFAQRYFIEGITLTGMKG